jgi:hypothetical protein
MNVSGHNYTASPDAIIADVPSPGNLYVIQIPRFASGSGPCMRHLNLLPGVGIQSRYGHQLRWLRTPALVSTQANQMESQQDTVVQSRCTINLPLPVIDCDL